jgi:hypothetical protein
VSEFFEKHSTAAVLGAIVFGLLLFIAVPMIWSFRHQAQVERNLKEIMPPAGATVTQHNVSNKWTQGVIGNYYRVDLTHDQIRAHYDAELLRHGWKFKEQIPLTTWDKDYGESQAIYCRGNYAAGVYFTGNRQTELGFRYALDISWGLGYCP